MSHPGSSIPMGKSGVASMPIATTTGAHNNNAPAPHTPSQQTRYLCALFGLVRYESTGVSSVGVPAPVAGVARLCSLLRAMCHTDGQKIMQGRQAVPVLEVTHAVANGIATNLNRNNVSTPSSLLTPQTPNSPFPHLATTGGGIKIASAGPNASPPATGFPSFTSIPTFHQASNTLLESISAVGLGFSTPPPPQTQLTHDTIYLTEREKRLQPIVNIIAQPTPWSLLVPTRYSRYVRVYRPTTPGATSHLADMQAWREIDLPTQPTTPPHHSTGGAPHETWRITHMGKTLLPTKTLCHVRPIRVTTVSTNYTALLEQNAAVAYERDYEFVQEGFRFEDRDGIEILVYQVLKVSAKTRTPSKASTPRPRQAEQRERGRRDGCMERARTQ